VRINEIEQSKVIKKRMSQLSSTTDFPQNDGSRGDDDGLWMDWNHQPRMRLAARF
jgi:hypothetical protein